MSWLRRWILGRHDDVAFCRRLSLEGWEHLVAADDAGGVALVSPGDDLWPVTVAAVGLYRGPVDVVAQGARLVALPGSWRRRFVDRVLAPDQAWDSASETLRAGGRVLLVSESATGGLGDLAVRLGSEAGATVLAAVADCPRRGRHRITVRPRVPSPRP